MRSNFLALFAIFAAFAVFAAVLFASCGGRGKHSAGAVSGVGVGKISGGEAVSYADAIEQIRSSPVPVGADPDVFEQLKDELTRLLGEFRDNPAARTAAAFSFADATQVSDLYYDEPSNLLVWSYANPGDYDLSGDVGIADITPIAVYYGALTGDGLGNDAYESWLDGDGNGEVGIGDVTLIALNFMNSVSGYEIMTSDDESENYMRIGGFVDAASLGEGFPKKYSVPLPEFSRKFVRVRPLSASGAPGKMSNDAFTFDSQFGVPAGVLLEEIEKSHIPPISSGGAILPTAFSLPDYSIPLRNQFSWKASAAFAIAEGAFNYELQRIYSGLGWSAINPRHLASPKHFYIESGKRDFRPFSPDGLRSLPNSLEYFKNYGVATEGSAPYDLVYSDAWSVDALADAGALNISGYTPIPCNSAAGIESVKIVLAHEKRPLVMSFKVNTKFGNLKTGEVWNYEAPPLSAGHAVLVVGYDNLKQAFKVKNSFGIAWGTSGYGWIGYGTFLNDEAAVRCWTLECEYAAGAAYRLGLVSLDAQPPSGFAASQGESQTEVLLSWNPVPGATGYKIYRDTSEAHFTIAGNVTEFADTRISDYYSHIYWVKAIGNFGETKLSAPALGYLKPPTGMPPVAIFSANPQTGAAPLEVEFSAYESYDPDGEIAKFEWDWTNDGVFDYDGGASPFAAHVYEAEGEYTCRLRVTDASGAVSDAELLITVKPYGYTVSGSVTFDGTPETGVPGVKLSLTTGKEAMTDENGRYTITGLDSGTHTIGAYKLGWTFSPSFLQFEIVDADPPEQNFKVANSPPVAVLKASPMSGPDPLTVTFDASESYDPDGGEIVEHVWQPYKNQASVSTGSFPKLLSTYSPEGTYEITVRITDDEGSQSFASIFITVEPPFPYTISGKVFESESPYDPISGIQVYLSGHGSAKSDINGNYTFNGVTYGDYIIGPADPSWNFGYKYKEITITNRNVEDINFYGEQAEERQEWIHTFGPTGSGGRAIIADSHGYVYVAGKGGYSYSEQKEYKAFLLKYSPNGRLLWQKGISDYSSHPMFIGSISLDSEENVILVGYYDYKYENKETSASLLIKISPDGELLWKKSLTVCDAIYDMFFDNDGMLITGRYDYNKAFIAKLDALGNAIWQKLLISLSSGTNNPSFLSSLKMDPFGDIIAAGYFKIRGGSGVHGWSVLVLKCDSSGNLKWVRNWNHNAFYNGMHGMDIDSDGNIYVVSKHNEQFNRDYYAGKTVLLKYSPDGDLLYQHAIGRKYPHSGFTNRIYISKDIIYLTVASSDVSRAICALTLEGDVLWGKRLEGDELWGRRLTGQNVIFHSIFGDGSGSLYLAGSAPDAYRTWEDVTITYEPITGTESVPEFTVEDAFSHVIDLDLEFGDLDGIQDIPTEGGDALIVKYRLD